MNSVALLLCRLHSKRFCPHHLIPMSQFRLTIHQERAQVHPVGEGLPFLGFMVYPDRRRLKRRKGVAYARRLRQMARQYADGEISLDQVSASVQGWINHVRYRNTIGLRKALLGAVSFTATRE